MGLGDRRLGPGSENKWITMASEVSEFIGYKSKRSFKSTLQTLIFLGLSGGTYSHGQPGHTGKLTTRTTCAI